MKVDPDECCVAMEFDFPQAMRLSKYSDFCGTGTPAGACLLKKDSSAQARMVPPPHRANTARGGDPSACAK